jgi:hypothetical protein
MALEIGVLRHATLSSPDTGFEACRLSCRFVMGNQSLGFPVCHAHKGTADERRVLRDIALRVAAKHYTHEEFRDLEQHLATGRVEVRLYEDWLVLTRIMK